MQDRIVLITGSTDGIGKQTAIGLANMGAHVLLHGRNSRKGHTVLDEIKNKTGNANLELFIADLSSQRQVRKLVIDVKQRHDRLHVLINNARVFMPERNLTEDGLETTFAVNHMAPFILTYELLELLNKSEPSRIINVASIAHWNARVDWSNFQGERYYDGFQAYATSKLGVILFTYVLAERLKDTGVTVNCLHPGVIKTKLLRAGFGDYPGENPEKGAQTSIYLASSPDIEKLSGLYFEKSRPSTSSPSSRDSALQNKFWQLSEKLYFVHLGKLV
ncbi:MAG: SDR family oxidoreductase [Methanotrichaceae archaeon]|nr:SDR family oxidoreductase [Methanotrichaceae archaeon]